MTPSRPQLRTSARPSSIGARWPGTRLGRRFRITDRAGGIVTQGKVEHGPQVVRIAGRHDHQVRKHTQVGQVKCAVMGRPVRTDQPGTVQHEHDGQVLQGHLLEDLVEAPLQERAVDVDDGANSHFGLPGGEGDRMRLANARVEKAVGKLLANRLQLVALAHRGRQHRDPRVPDHLLADRLPRHIGECRGLAPGRAPALRKHPSRRGACESTPGPRQPARSRGLFRSRRAAGSAPPGSGPSSSTCATPSDRARRSAPGSESPSPQTACPRATRPSPPLSSGRETARSDRRTAARGSAS